MDILGALKNEIFRPLASVVLPGTLALAPYAIVVSNAIPEVKQFYQTQASWFLFAVLAGGTIVGMLLEDIGSSIERGIDRCMDLEYLYGHEEVWLAYLSCGATDNNGRRFLGTTVTRLKFINSLMPALFFFSLGIVWLHYQTDLWKTSSIAIFLFCVAVLMSWLFRTSTELSEVASTTRFCLLKPAERPKAYDVDARTVRRVRHFAYALGEVITSRASDIDLTGRTPFAIIPESFMLFFGLKKTKTEISSPPSSNDRDDSAVDTRH